MKDFGNILIIILFFFISCGAIFVNSYSFMDSQIVPKWYWVLGGSTVLGFVFAIMKLLNRRKIENNGKGWNIFFFIIYILCFFQALYGFSLYLGLLQDREAILVGSFDNPAGFTACLSGGLPFMIYFLKYKNMRWVTVVAICVVVCLFLFVCIQNCVKTELYWYKTAIQSFLGRTNEVLIDYDNLEKAMGNNASFLYNWGAELHEIGYYKKSITVLLRCEKLCNNSDIQLLIADSYCQLKDYKQAERHYALASHMCPKLFLPLYELMNLYKMIGNEAKAKKIAFQILEKPVKVNSPVIDEIKHEMREFLNVFL